MHRIMVEHREQVERYMADPERCMPSERARLEQAGFNAKAMTTEQALAEVDAAVRAMLDGGGSKDFLLLSRVMVATKKLQQALDAEWRKVFAKPV